MVTLVTLLIIMR